MTVKKLVVCCVLATVAQFSHAIQIFSLELDSDRLVTIESTTGQVSVVGNLGYAGIIDADLTFHNGKVLAAVDLDFGLGGPKLLEINPNTGAVESAKDFLLPGNYLDYVEGIASTGTDVYLSTTWKNRTGNYYSDAIYHLDPTTGLVSSPTSFYPQFADADFDALDADSSGQLYGFNVEPGLYRKVYSFPDPTTAVEVAVYNDADYYHLDDMVHVGTTQIGLSSYFQDYITTGSTLDGSVSSRVFLSETGDFRGAALAPVPEPGSMLVLGGAIAAFARRRRSR